MPEEIGQVVVSFHCHSARNRDDSELECGCVAYISSNELCERHITVFLLRLSRLTSQYQRREKYIFFKPKFSNGKQSFLFALEVLITASRNERRKIVRDDLQQTPLHEVMTLKAANFNGFDTTRIAYGPHLQLFHAGYL